ncbi:hypothetical protein HC031_22325 [Planosporangium thailandense]|uniref:Uncharacterized protein n=1 Tax=Planosporangium thailandense TaxID=765197 RepID=A0ABX0Y276_9ACTN|nr:hypothetical protein [Planosporangium thailandense]NJC72433.1 hypothetical protein [Planosporangium thailandense]
MTSMKARHFAPVTPLETEPLGAYTDPAQRDEALRDALRGVELGTYDQRMIDWAVKRFDNSALRVFVSWLERVRTAGVVSVLHIDRARQGNLGRFER